MRLYYADLTEKAMNILRSKTRFDFYLTDCEGLTTLYTDRDLARKAALELRTKPYRRERKILDISGQEMCLVIIDVEEPADLEFKRFEHGDGTVVVIINDYYEVLKASQFSVEIVPDTYNYLALYEGRIPECGAGIGPTPKEPQVLGIACNLCRRTCLCSSYSQAPEYGAGVGTVLPPVVPDCSSCRRSCRCSSKAL